MAPICSKRRDPEANETTQTHCNSPVTWLFGHIARMDDNTDAKRVLSLSLLRTGGDLEDAPASIQQDLRSYNLTLPEAMDEAQNQSLWRMWSTYDATQS